MRPRADLERYVKSPPHQDWIPGPSSPQQARRCNYYTRPANRDWMSTNVVKYIRFTFTLDMIAVNMCPRTLCAAVVTMCTTGFNEKPQVNSPARKISSSNLVANLQ